ncbi:amylo-alpha-1,6-glucosidase [Prolixibacter sp. NT017]|uniref:amylo-alpha-1,6-glucosidase n=1 Tax=Prolixibacter sp. NT017 TaxID=2652390 RepID=UPI00126C13CC|nr:amylo-alpha-1,6-glucosidase [Prolixibacter sp. NT017]GET24385.1 glycogen debranching protein [Prolixibacter sp. NT017]
MLDIRTENKNNTLSAEWLVTNGIGGYASSTVSGANTRRYHGLLVAALNPPVERKVMVSKVEETIVTDDGNFELGSNFYPGVIYPEGYKTIESFERTPLPKTVFYKRGHRLSKTIFMVHGSNTTVVEYENVGTEKTKLQLNPMFLYRDYHSLYKEDDSFCHYYDMENSSLQIFACDHSEPLFFKYSAGKFNANYFWHKNNEYPREQERGQDFLEDTFSIGYVEINLSPGERIFLMFSDVSEMLAQNPEILKQDELLRLKLLNPKNNTNQFFADLAATADQFIVFRESTQSYSIIAGYHWFTDWGRDTMIALQGLGIALGKKVISKSILNTFFKSIDKGMLPNRFSDNEKDTPEYNTIDATLWLFDTLYKYYLKFGDADFVKENLHHLEEIIKWHFKGTRYNIHLTKQGFLSGGERISQLTWMDARIGDYVVTPRQGMPVEIQALWYNALQVYLFFANELQEKPTPFQSKIQKTAETLKKNFKMYFLNENGYLNDVVQLDKSADAAIRPNQVYAISLSFPILDKETGKSILDTVDKYLFTSYGLRTLSPEHKDFRPVYEGNQWERDTAYHQGTVWPFLLADYFQACLYVFGLTPEVQEKLKESVQVLQQHFYEDGCVNGIAEIFDGLNPGRGKGTVNQAWSVSALIQLLSHSKQL